MHIRQLHRVLPRERMRGIAGDDEFFCIQCLCTQRFGKAGGACHDRDVDFPFGQALGQPVRQAFDQGDVDARMQRAEMVQKCDEPYRTDGAHHAQCQLRTFQP